MSITSDPPSQQLLDSRRSGSCSPLRTQLLLLSLLAFALSAPLASDVLSPPPSPPHLHMAWSTQHSAFCSILPPQRGLLFWPPCLKGHVLSSLTGSNPFLINLSSITYYSPELYFCLSTYLVLVYPNNLKQHESRLSFLFTAIIPVPATVGVLESDCCCTNPSSLFSNHDLGQGSSVPPFPHLQIE